MKPNSLRKGGKSTPACDAGGPGHTFESDAWDRPVAAALRISGITLSILRSGHGDSAGTPGRPLSRLPAKLSTGMWLASAKEATARRNA